MIAGLSKAVTLYLSPLLALTAILLTLFSFLAPVLLLRDQVALLTVVPSTALLKPGTPEAIDGPTVFLGVLGSCSRANNAASINCTTPAFSTVYDFTVLPSNAPFTLLSAPAASTPAFIAISLLFSGLFFFTFTLISFRHKMGEKLSNLLDKPLLQRISAWIGVLSFLFGLASFLILRMWFGKAVQDFNSSVAVQGQQGPELLASIGNAFTMVWVGYAFLAGPVIVSLSKLHVKATKF